MDNKKKILLGEKDILSRDNEDLFLNVNLNSTFTEIRNDKFENVFDVENQFKKERNSSRDFRIYGVIDSTVTHSDNLTIEVYSDSGATGLFNLLTSINSTNLVYDEKNVYGKKRGKYIIELDSYEHDFVYIKILSNNLNYKDQFYVQQLIFRDADGTFVEYGTQTIDISENGDAVEINNDFYFLFNKHWVKKDLLIVEEKPAIVFINSTDDTSSISEFTTPADTVTIEVKLDKPSPFGLERVDLSRMSSTLDIGEISIIDSSNNLLSLPHTIAFSPGEQSKNYIFYSPLDDIQEFLEDVTLELTNFVNVNTGETLQHTVFVSDRTPRNKVKLNFQDVYQNRNYFTARVHNPGSVTPQSFPMPAVLRNGLFFEATPMEFYPSDNYVLKIKNVGNNTILPINPKLGITNEQLFLSNQELTFNITQEYTNIEKHSIKLTFKTLNNVNSDPNYSAFNDGFRINGVPIVSYLQNYRISYNSFLAYFKKLSLPGFTQAHDGWSAYSLDVPFDIIEDAANLQITLVAKNSGTRLDLFSYGDFPSLFEMLDVDYDVYGIKAEVVQEFIYGSQIPLEIELGANTGNNNFAQYQFTISKVGYDLMSFTCSPLGASLTPSTYYMVSGLNTILRNWNDSTSSVVYNHDHVTSDWGINSSNTNPVFGKYKTGDVYINGMVLLANLYFSNSLLYNAVPQSVTPLNSSHAINSSGNFSHDFLASPIVVIPETNSEFSLSDVAQVGYLGINSSYYSDPYQTTPRSFEFRTGTTVPYNLYETKTLNAFGKDLWNFYSTVRSSNGIPGTNYAPTNPNLGLRLDAFLQNGDASKGITSQGLIGVTPISNAEYTSLFNSVGPFGTIFSYIKLTSATPGVPFEFKNFKEAKYLAGPNTGQDITNRSMLYFEEIPNQQAGITINKANNKMGGFSVTHP